jgi:Flp pilus assembly protein TadG
MLRRAARRRGQATIEFAFVAPLFFLCFFAAIDAALWAIQTSASVSAAEQAARLAAAAANSPQSEDTPSPAVLFAATRNQL